MESHLEEKILVGREVSLLGAYGKVLFTEDGIPRELGSDIPQIGKLHCFAEFAVDDHCSKPDGLFH